jgi:polyhydroxybutyrate depolymerase
MKRSCLCAPAALLLLFTMESLALNAAGRLSAGCGHPAPPEPPATIEVDGTTRDFILAVPESYDTEVPHRLVFAFHGRTTPNTRVQRYFRIEQSSTEPTIFVYPAALTDDDGKFSWYERGQSGDKLRDYALFDALLAELGSGYCIDPARVFIVGHSLGGSFANSLGCARGAVIRGVGTVAGRIWESECSGPTAAMLMHNPHDDLVPVSRGLHARDWALAQNGLEPPARPCEPRALECECYGPPGSANPVVWCPHTEDTNRHGKFYPHLWPVEAGAAIMEFFDSLPSHR